MRFRFRFNTKYNEQTGLLRAFDLGLERFQPGRGTYDKYYTRSDAKPKPYDESGWEGQQDETVNFVGDTVDVGSLPTGTIFHVLFHFHDNYCDAALGFLDRAQAEAAFQKKQDELWEKIEMYEQHNSGCDFCIVKHDKWHCDFLECELTGCTSGWTRPDKGDTWWLRSLAYELL